MLSNKGLMIHSAMIMILILGVLFRHKVTISHIHVLFTEL